MRIFTVTEDEFPGALRLFKNHQVEVLPKNYSNVKADLIVFTGGADIQPGYYGMPTPKHGDFNPDRDDWEIKVFNSIRSGELRGKVLGWCRGMQLLCVGMGGTLIYDIKKECKFEHPPLHEISWMYSNRLQACFSRVNSLHHQGIKHCRDSSGFKLIAYETRTGVPEIAKWGDRFLGVQFHPEMMTDLPGTTEFVHVLEEWVATESTSTFDPSLPKKKLAFNWET